MTLSSEDRDRIYEEEKARKEAQDRITREQDQAKKDVARRKGKWFGLGAFILLAVVWVIGSLTQSNNGKGQRAAALRANTLKEGRAACASREILEALAEAIRMNDQRAARTLMQRGCIRTTQGMPVSVLDATWTGIVKVRVSAGAEAVELWTLSESLQE